MTPHAVYIHFPYCLYRCHYCDFNSYAWDAGRIPHDDYIGALVEELAVRERLFQAGKAGFLPPRSRIDSVFFGGGTPSLMRPGDVARLLSELSRRFSLVTDCEVTLEVNPGTVDARRLGDFVRAGVNRFSIGVQSLSDSNLKRFGRIHTGAQAVAAIEAALLSGAGRVSADLIFGFPEQTLAGWRSDLATILRLGLCHISCYALTAELGTRYTNDVRTGRLRETEAELMADMQELTYELTGEAGLTAYEISNFAKEGWECRHNLNYWRYGSFLGLGAGAVSNFCCEVARSQGREVAGSVVVVRQQNTAGPSEYVWQLRQARPFFTTEYIKKKTAMAESLMMGLRLKEGISLKAFLRRFGEPLQVVYGPALSQAIRAGWLVNEGERLCPTRQGFFFNNRLVQLFF